MIINGFIFVGGVFLGWVLFEKPEIVRTKLTNVKLKLIKLWRRIND